MFFTCAARDGENSSFGSVMLPSRRRSPAAGLTAAPPPLPPPPLPPRASGVCCADGMRRADYLRNQQQESLRKYLRRWRDCACVVRSQPFLELEDLCVQYRLVLREQRESVSTSTSASRFSLNICMTPDIANLWGRFNKGRLKSRVSYSKIAIAASPELSVMKSRCPSPS